MKITEGQLRRIIREEARRLTEMPATARPKGLDRLFKKPSPYNSAQSVDGYEMRMFRQQMKQIARMLGARDIEGLRESDSDKVVAAVELEGMPGMVRRLDGEDGWAIARTGTLNGEPVVVVENEDDGFSVVYKWVG